MSKKLLEEQAVRKFMKIAGLQPLTNNFLKESEEQKDLEEAKAKDKKEMEEGYGKKEEAAKKDGEKLEEEVEDLEEGKEELDEERSGFVSEREDDERATSADRVHEGKALVNKKATTVGQKQGGKPKPAKMPKGALKEEEVPEEGSEDVEAPEMDAAPEGDMGASGLDVEGLVKELVRVITDKIPGAADVISVEEEGGEAEVEMGGDEGGEGDMEGGEGELDEAALESVVAETVKRVKARLMESQKPKTLTKEALAKKVAAKVAERLKKG